MAKQPTLTPKQFLKVQSRIERRIKHLEKSLDRARDQVVVPPMEKLRPAEPDDLKEDAIIFHRQLPSRDYSSKDPAAMTPENWYWHQIAEVHHPDDDFKAYTADDGCRYGLHEAYVEK